MHVYMFPHTCIQRHFEILMAISNMLLNMCGPLCGCSVFWFSLWQPGAERDTRRECRVVAPRWGGNELLWVPCLDSQHWASLSVLYQLGIGNWGIKLLCWSSSTGTLEPDLGLELLGDVLKIPSPRLHSKPLISESSVMKFRHQYLETTRMIPVGNQGWGPLLSRKLCFRLSLSLLISSPSSFI